MRHDTEGKDITEGTYRIIVDGTTWATYIFKQVDGELKHYYDGLDAYMTLDKLRIDCEIERVKGEDHELQT